MNTRILITLLSLVCVSRHLYAIPVLSICPESGGPASKALRDQLKQTYGIHPCMWSGYVDEPSKKERHDWFAGKKISDNLNAAYIYTIAAGEGLVLYFDGTYTKGNLQTAAKDKNYWIDSFLLLGMDRFVEDLPRLRERKLLPDAFKEGVQFIRNTTHVNENGTHVISPDFKTFDDAVTAFTAALKLRNLLMKEDAKSAGYTMDANQEAFWTYAYYCLGEGKAKAEMIKAGGNLHKYKATATSNVPDAIRQRVGGWKIVEQFSLFKSSP